MVKEKLYYLYTYGKGIQPKPVQKTEIHGIPRYISESDIKPAVKKVKKEYVVFMKDLKNKTNKKKGRYQIKDEFGEWQDIKKLAPKLRKILSDKFESLHREKWDTFINKISLHGYKGIKGIGNTAWLALLSISQETNSAHGGVAYDHVRRESYDTFPTGQLKHTFQVRIRRTKK